MNFRLFIALVLLGSVLAVGQSVLATSREDIAFPVAELGDCGSEEECKAYCDETAHMEECLAFAERHNLVSPEEAEHMRKFVSVGEGPGGCAGPRECEAYCSDMAHMEECLAFAEANGMLPPEELEEARKVARALQQGAELPGGCRNEAECEAYCADPSHMRECIAFAERAGFLEGRELKEARQMLQALEAGIPMPGNCRERRECEAYCEEPAHMEECVEFGIAAGFIPPEEAAQARTIAPLMAQGLMPGGCKNRAECEAYCSEPAHGEECTSFFVEAGFMTPEEAEIFRKTGGRGPGGCRGEEECEAFCNDPANQETCFQFAQQHGLIPEEELRHIREGVQRFKEGIEHAPPEVAQCLTEKIGEEVLSKIEAGTFTPNPELGEQMRMCFEEFFPKDQEEFGLPGGLDEGLTREQKACIERILGEVQGPPSPEAEERIGRECFGEAFGPPPDEALPPEAECIRRITGSLDAQPTSEQERQIAHECFGVPAEDMFEQQPGSLIGAFQPFLKLLGL